MEPSRIASGANENRFGLRSVKFGYRNRRQSIASGRIPV